MKMSDKSANKKRGKKSEKAVSSGVNSVIEEGNGLPSPNELTGLGKVAAKGQGSVKVKEDKDLGHTLKPKPREGVFPDRPIGPGNPPRDAVWKPGKSANPKGYPKGQLHTKTIIKYWLNMKEEIKNPLDPTKILKVKVIDTMTLGLITKARAGDVAAFRELMDRTEGKPIQSNKILLPGTKGLEIKIGFKAPVALTNLTPAPPATNFTIDTKPKEE